MKIPHIIGIVLITALVVGFGFKVIGDYQVKDAITQTTKSFQESAIKAHTACYDEETGIWKFKTQERISKDYVGIAVKDGMPVAAVATFMPTQNIDPVLTAEQVEAEIKKEKSKSK